MQGDCYPATRVYVTPFFVRRDGREPLLERFDLVENWLRNKHPVTIDDSPFLVNRDDRQLIRERSDPIELRLNDHPPSAIDKAPFAIQFHARESPNKGLRIVVVPVFTDVRFEFRSNHNL